MILHTSVNGHGEPIIFLHTALQTGATELDIQKDYFKENYQVILPDLRGHGKSVSNDFSNYFFDSSQDLLETLNDLNIESVHLAGCSLGGLVALYFAKRNPSRVKTLTLSGIIPEKPGNWEEINNEENININNILKNNETVDYFNSIHEGKWQELLQSVSGTDWHPFEETEDLSGLDIPTLFIVGETAELETVGTIKYPKTNDNIHVSIIPFAGHTPHLDQPELYNNIVELFLIKSDDT